MPRRTIHFEKGYFYHLYNRGIGRKKIFYESENYLYFLRLVKRTIPSFMFSIIAYCLMPNHFHFLIRVNDNTNVSLFMSRLLNSYVKAINKRYNLTGSLFGERYKIIRVANPNYLLHLCRYIHLNPIKAGIVSDLKDWPFSNYLEFVDKREGTIFDKSFRNEYFIDGKRYEDFVLDFNIKEPEGFEKVRFD